MAVSILAGRLAELYAVIVKNMSVKSSAISQVSRNLFIITVHSGACGAPNFPGPREKSPVHRVFLTVPTVLFTVAVVFFAPYVNFRRILSS